jgi:hypothetical protein
MRKTLFAAAALAPLLFLAGQTSAAAQTTISSGTSTPQTTAADGDITISSGGTITPKSANSAAVTVNSSNNVSSTGSISFKDLNNVVGIAIQGGNGSTASPLNITNTGAITVNESFASSDTNKDGVNEAPFANPLSSGRYAIQLTGTSAFIGNVTNASGGVITVQGSNANGAGTPSYGISLEAPLTGTLTNAGTISYVGDNGGGMRETAGVSGNVLVSGTISVIGQNSNALALSGAVGGRVSVYAALTSTDYGTTTRPTTSTELATVQGTANTSINEVNPNAGSAMVVSGSVGAGVYIGAAPSNTNSTDTTTDRDGDGIIDSGETAGSVTTYGQAPALVIGGPGAVTIGSLAATPALPTGDTSNVSINGYGVAIAGSVEGLGLYDGVTANALQIGGVVNPATNTVTGTVNIPGGVYITGSVEATSYAANALAIHIGSGASISTINSSGTITASVFAPNTTTSTIPSFNATATALQIDAGATVSSLTNSGSIAASVTGGGGTINAVAVVDRGGGITSVTNSGVISVALEPDATGATVTGSGVVLANGSKTENTTGLVALDLSANTSGVTLVQKQAPGISVATTTTNGVTTSVVTSVAVPAGTLTQTTVAESTTTTSGNTTTVVTAPASPSITGDIYLGNGPNTVSFLAGTVTGALDLGSGPTSSLTIDNGAVYTGALSYGGQALTVNVNNGTLNNSSPATYNTASLHVGATGVLYFGIDPVNNKASQFVLSSGTATFDSGAKIGLTFISNATAAESFTLVSAHTLTVGETSTALAGPVPFMFNSSIQSNPAAGTVTLTISPKTAAQMGLNPSQTAALPATYQALTLDGPVQAAFLGQYTRGGFLSLYNQLLPDYAGGTFQAANAASLAISRATAESNDIENPTGSRGAWMQEIFVGVNQGTGLTDGFRGGGVGFVGGVETGGSGLGAFGVTSAFVTTSIADPHVPGDSQTAMSELEIGGYWQGEFSGLTADARLGAGYTWMAGRRELVQTDATTGDITLDRKVKSNWDGYTLSGRFGLSYRWSFNDHVLGGGWFLQPQAHLDYFMLTQNAYHDNEAEAGPALSMAFQSSTGQETSGTASITIGRKLGTGLVWRPQLELGVRDVFTGDAGNTTARFEGTNGAATGASFTLTPADITGPAGIARFKLKASSEYYEIGVEAGGEVLSSRYQEGDVKASIRVLF